MNAEQKATAPTAESIDPRYGNIEAIQPAKGKLAKPSQSELRWLKSNVPTIGPHDDLAGGEAQFAAKA